MPTGGAHRILMFVTPGPVTPSPWLRLFAGVHLRSSAERAVYAVVAGGPERAWSSAEVARHAALELHEVDQVLRRFAGAGIVECSDDGRVRRYRWAAAMAYLFDDVQMVAGPGTSLDPVCGMPVPVGSPYRRDGAGGLVLFCSAVCVARYDAAVRRGGSRPSDRLSQ